MLYPIGSRLSLGILAAGISLSLGCGKNKSKAAQVSLINLTQYEILQFKSSASSFGVSGTRYDLNLEARTIEKYMIDSDSGTYAQVGDATITLAMKNDLETKLQKVDYLKFGTCSDCNATRPSVWVEITEVSPALYYFSNEGDCSCASDGDNAPTLQYGAMKEIYDEMTALF